MSGPKKPGDETIRAVPEFGTVSKKDSFSTLPSSPSHPALSGVKQPTTGSHKATEVAPEVSQGPWRERAFTPRGVMSRDEVLSSLADGLAQAVTKPTLFECWDTLRHLWVPVLRQSLEQGGGDGIDAWLQTVLKPPGRNALDPLMGQCVAGLARIRSANAVAELKGAGEDVVSAVRAALDSPRRRKLSFKQMEKELEGKLEVDELLMIASATDSEIERRLTELDQVLQQLRDQIRSRPGQRPDGMYSNFARFKAEARVLAAEKTRRSSTATTLPGL